MNTVKPHMFIRLVEALFERVFRTAVAAGPALGGVISHLASHNVSPRDEVDQMTVLEYEDGTPYFEASEHDQWSFHYGQKKGL